MEAVELRGKGLETLVLGDRPAPVPGPGEALIDVHAVGLNHRDLAIARGDYPAGAPLPLVPGSDVAGVVRQAPEGAAVRPGDRVVASYVVDWISGPPEASRVVRRVGGPLPGGLAQQIALPVHALVKVPSGLDLTAAASLSIAGVTAWRALFRAAALRPGQTVLLFGTGGVSTFALQLAEHAGVRAIVVGRSESSLAAARALGASLTIDTSRTPDWSAAILDATGGLGVQASLDVLGGETLGRAASVTAVGGTVVLLGFVTGTRAQLDLPAIIRRSLRLQAVSGGSREDLEELVRVLGSGGPRPVLDGVFPLTSYREAFARLDGGGLVGKVVVEVAQ